MIRETGHAARMEDARGNVVTFLFVYFKLRSTLAALLEGPDSSSPIKSVQAYEI